MSRQIALRLSCLLHPSLARSLPSSSSHAPILPPSGPLFLLPPFLPSVPLCPAVAVSLSLPFPPHFVPPSPPLSLPLPPPLRHRSFFSLLVPIPPSQAGANTFTHVHQLRYRGPIRRHSEGHLHQAGQSPQTGQQPTAAASVDRGHSPRPLPFRPEGASTRDPCGGCTAEDVTVALPTPPRAARSPCPIVCHRDRLVPATLQWPGDARFRQKKGGRGRGGKEIRRQAGIDSPVTLD